MPDYSPDKRTALADVADETRYLITSQPEVQRVLRDLAKRPDIITAYLNGGETYFLTAVLGVLPERAMVVLDQGSDEKLNELALKSDRLVCVTRHEHVAVRFTLTGVQRAKYQGQAVFAASLPGSVYRPQRREYFRVTTPAYNPLRVRVPQPDGDPYELVVADLSCGGMGMLDPDGCFGAQPGEVIQDCGLELPGFGFVVFDLEIRNRLRVRRHGGEEVDRVGCQFLGLSIDATALIQRYLHKLQLETKR